MRPSGITIGKTAIASPALLEPGAPAIGADPFASVRAGCEGRRYTRGVRNFG
jgi:hypothetical protein